MKHIKKDRPKIKDYDAVNGAGAYDYVSDVNGYMNYLEQQIKNLKIPVVSCCHTEICIVEQKPTDGNVIQPTKIFIECTECNQILPIHRIIKREEKIPLFNDCS